MRQVHFLMFFVFTLLIIGESQALPRFSLKGGAVCQDCHVNPTGGELRTDRGWNFGKKFLPMNSQEKEEFLMTNRIGENIYFGLDLRGQYLVRTTEENTRTDFQRMNASIYTAIDLSDKISVQARYDFIQQIYEGYAVARILPNDSYIKGGTFSPNYGVRIDDHTAYTRGGDLGLLFATGNRQGLIYEPRYVESGAEVGVYFDEYAFLTASVGNPRTQLFQTDPSYTANLMITPPTGEDVHLFVGGSYSNFKDQRFTPSFQTIYPEVQMYGGYLGFGAAGFTLIGEYDFANDLTGTDIKSGALMIEASYRIIRGLDAVIRYDRFDPDSDIEKDEVSRVVFGFEFFPYSFIEIRPQFRLQMEDPDVNNNSFVIQSHIYY